MVCPKGPRDKSITCIASDRVLLQSPQLDSADEQAAAIRRELDARREKTSEMERVREREDIHESSILLQNRKMMPKFVLKDMEGLYIEEMNTAINTLKANLESLPVKPENECTERQHAAEGP